MLFLLVPAGHHHSRTMIPSHQIGDQTPEASSYIRASVQATCPIATGVPRRSMWEPEPYKLQPAANNKQQKNTQTANHPNVLSLSAFQHRCLREISELPSPSVFKPSHHGHAPNFYELDVNHAWSSHAVWEERMNLSARTPVYLRWYRCCCWRILYANFAKFR